MKAMVTIKLMLCLPLILILLPISLSLDFSYQSEIVKGQEFSINIISDSSETSDVKAYVGKDTKEYSEIFYNNNWKSPRNYLKSVFPEETEFILRAHIIGETNICIKLRNSEDIKQIEEICHSIIVKEVGGEKSIEKPELEEEHKEERNEAEPEYIQEEEPKIEQPTEGDTIIHLEYKSLNDESKLYYSKDGLFRIVSYLAFVLLIAFILLLVFLKKI